MSQQRQLAAILFTDIVGYTAIMQQDEQTAVSIAKQYVSVLKQFVPSHGGEILNDYGDGSLCTFTSATEAVRCAIEMQQQLQTEPKVPLRIGLHIGEIFFEGGKVFGDGVNVASRIQSLGQANTILFSKEIFDKIRNQSEFKSISLGQFEFKNVNDPVEVFALANEGLIVPKRESMEGKLKKRPSTKRRLILGASILVLVIASFLIYRQFFRKPVFSGSDKSIAVLPFTNLSDDKEQEYFAEGISDDILDQLVKTTDLKVKSRTATLRFRNTKQDPSKIGIELGVSTLLEGSIWKSGDKIKIVAQLIDVKSGDHLFSEVYDRAMKNIFEVRGEVAQKVAAALSSNFNTRLHSQDLKKHIPSPESYNAYLKGRFFWNQRTAPALKRGIESFQQAVEIDPLNATAYSGLADCYSALGYGSWLSPQESFPKAKAAATKALELDSTLAEPHASLGYFKFYYDWDWPGAEKEFLKAISLNPNYAIAYQWYGWYLTSRDRFKEAEEMIKKAEVLDPLSAPILTDMGFSYYYGKDFDKAIKHFRSSLELNPNLLLTHLLLGRVYQDKKMFKEAIDEYKIVLNTAKEWTVALAAIGNIYGLMGEKQEARKILDQMKILSDQKKFMTPYGVALVYAGLGETDETFAWLNKAYEEKAHWLVWLNLDQRWNSIRSDKRFAPLVAKVGLPAK